MLGQEDNIGWKAQKIGIVPFVAGSRDEIEEDSEDYDSESDDLALYQAEPKEDSTAVTKEENITKKAQAFRAKLKTMISSNQ